MNFLNKKNGFTLVEMLVVVAIMLILLGGGVAGFLSLRKSQILNSTADQITSIISDARSRTLASDAASVYGVHFESGKVVLFKGGVYSPSSPDNKEVIFHQLAEISATTLNGGGSDVVFERLTGKTGEHGVITIRRKDDVSRTATVTILSTGLVSVVFN